MFRINRGTGFQIELANGYTISVQFGGGNYCSRYNDDINKVARLDWGYMHESPDAEVAIIDPQGNFVDMDGDNVASRVTPDELFRLIGKYVK